MKRTAMIIAGLMALGSASAFAEGGAERMRYYFESLRLAQQQALGQASQSAELRVPDDQTAQMTESYKDRDDL
ncbi:hypothetical protein [Pseudomonas sp. PDM31]|jgi:hypothetical protein|uniref:hypothetical protein n=1 Tax=Pseudomonas sp. PDM31 TaxID=2854778 RepID=UPI001C448A07|nr:hypothetical protein [Pseudomonas sp. PDM31]MBV7481081.1 hypothetical protein [Pseudomonas sp. PDM31]